VTGSLNTAAARTGVCDRERVAPVSVALEASPPAGHAIGIAFLIRPGSGNVEVCCDAGESAAATVSKTQLADWLRNPQEPLRVPFLEFIATSVNDISISVPGLDRWTLSPATLALLRASVTS
jgi:hypothetical protein